MFFAFTCPELSGSALLNQPQLNQHLHNSQTLQDPWTSELGKVALALAFRSRPKIKEDYS